MAAVKDGMTALARWPLLLGAVALYCVSGFTAEGSDSQTATLVAVTTAVVGSLMLGAWIWSLAIETERNHHRQHRRQDDCPDASTPPATGETQDGVEGSEG